MKDGREKRYRVEASPVGCLEKNLTVRVETLTEALRVAAELRSSATVPAVAIIDQVRGELVAAG